MHSKYRQIRFFISVILNSVASLLLIFSTYNFGRQWWMMIPYFTRITFICCFIIWEGFTVIWRVGKWWLDRYNTQLVRNATQKVPENFKTATPDGIEYFLLAGALALILSGWGDVYASAQILIILEWVGVGILLLGFVIAIWGRFTLHNKWHRNVRIPQHIVDNGPYKYVRHPIYAAEIIMALGTSIWSNNLLVFALLVGGMFGFNYLRCSAEENALLRYFGKDYSDFMEKRPRFFPFFLQTR